jgi:hypothetical protein
MTIKFKIENSMQFKSCTYLPESHTWNITMTGNDWPWMMKIAEVIRCPECKTTNIKKNGFNVKHNRQYSCLNDNCTRSSFVI